jgi:hypothetical protein
MSIAQLYYYTRTDEHQPAAKTPECYKWEAIFAANAARNERAERRRERAERRERRKRKKR